MRVSIEECYVRKIECGIRSIKLGNKKPSEVSLNSVFDRLGRINDGLCDELLKKYDKIVIEYKKKIIEKEFGSSR